MDRTSQPPLTGYPSTAAFRYTSYDTPFWSRNNREDGRRHRVGDGATQYLPLHPDGAWTELARLRFMFASTALAAGVTVFELARVMGTSVAMIERHYGASLGGAHAGIAGRLDALEAELRVRAE